MPYVKQLWESGDIVTAQKLNHMEDGIENAGGIQPLVIIGSQTGSDFVFNKTWQEVKNAFPMACMMATVDSGVQHVLVTGVMSTSSRYYVTVAQWNDPFSASSVDGYPSVPGVYYHG